MKRAIKTSNLEKNDPEIARLNRLEEGRQFWYADFIASENYASPAVREASSSVATNKYSEGYPGARYYKGSDVAIDQIEILAQKRALKLFGLDEKVWGANVQAASGSEANLAVYGALLKPKNHPDKEDIALGMRLDSGGHLTHGFYVSFSGKLFRFEQYGLDSKGYIDYAQVEELSEKFKPKLIVCGASAYSRIIDFERLGKIAKKHGALLMADVAHIAGLIAGGVHPSPFPHCNIVTTTTHKTLRGPRGAIIFARKDVAGADPVTSKERSIFQMINSAVFPGLQGGPHNQQTMAIAVCLKEADTPQFRAYAKRVVKNAQTLCETLTDYGFDIVSHGTDNHLMLVDLRPFGVNGEDASEWLSRAGIITNKNAIPNDPLPPQKASGIRLGTPAMTTRGMGAKEMKQFAKWIYEIIQNPSDKNLENIKKQVRALCKKFPPPGFGV
ncbi:MAG: serine hydroxymethyltransferase [Candidatus Spechtbacterales bacterium]